MPASARPGALYLEEQLARLPHQFWMLRTFHDSLTGLSAVLERVLVPRARQIAGHPRRRRHFLPRTEGDLHGLPDRVFAPQRYWRTSAQCSVCDCRSFVSTCAAGTRDNLPLLLAQDGIGSMFDWVRPVGGSHLLGPVVAGRLCVGADNRLTALGY